MTLEERNRIHGEDPENEEEEDDDDDEEEEEEDLVDPMDSVRETCGSSKPCLGYKEKLEICNDRVNGKSQTEETCVEELFDFLHCADSCVSKNLFQHLK